MRGFIVGFCVGMLALCLYCRHLPNSLWILFAAIISSILTLCLPKYLRSLSWGIIVGFIWLFIHVTIILDQALPPAFIAKNIMVTGRVISLPKVAPHYTQFILLLQNAHYKNSTFNYPLKIKLHWYSKWLHIHAGQVWQLQVRLKQPHSTFNPGGFDYERWLFSQNIRAVGYVRNSSKNNVIKKKQGLFNLTLWREELSYKLIRLLNKSLASAILLALVLGDRRYISASQWHVLQNTGTSHLVAISGLHIGLIAGFCFALFAWLWRRLPIVALYIPVQHVAAIAAIMGALMYSAMAGFALPTQRALVMICALLLMSVLRKQSISYYSLLGALLIILLLQPLAILSMSFWLSFTAVSILLYALSGRVYIGTKNAFVSKALQWWRAHWVIWLGLMPITLLFFQQVSLVAILANIIAIPWLSLLIVPLALLGCCLLLINQNMALPVLHIAIALINYLWQYLTILSHWQNAKWQYSIPYSWEFLAILLGVIFLLAPRGFPGRYLGGIFLLPLLFWHEPSPVYGAVRFTLLDVGQGLSAVVQTAKHVLIFDTGAKYSPDFDMGKTVVLPFLHYYYLHKINMMVISHGDNDHIGGAQSIINNTIVKQIVTSVPQRFIAAKRQHIKVAYCLAGQHWQWDGVRFKFLYPTSNILKLHKDNNQSCVLRVTVGKTHILLTGDIEALAESYLIKHDVTSLAANILVVPHHGSKTSSTWPFIEKVMPQYALFPVGYLNRYGFPKSLIVKRYQAEHATVFRTDITGAITFNIGRKGKIKQFSCYRYLVGHFWNQGN